MFTKLLGKKLQKILGYLNYYLSFAGPFYAVINRLLQLRKKSRYSDIWKWLLDKSTFKLCDNQHKPVMPFWCDATQHQTKAATNKRGCTEIRTSHATCIMLNELRAALLAAKCFVNLDRTNQFKLLLFTDNFNVFLFN